MTRKPTRKTPTATLSRRGILRAAAGSLALPLLPERLARAADGPLPKRLLVVFVPEGVEQAQWWASTVRSETDFDLGPSLAPLAPHRSDITLVKGVCNASGFHDDGVRDVITGGSGSPAMTVGGKTYAGGISVDQMVAQHVQGDRAIRSYQLGVMAVGDDGRSTQRFSWESASARRAVVNNPVKAFDDLVGGGAPTDPAAVQARKQRLAMRKSTLDELLPQLARFRCTLGVDGRQKLEQHEAAVRAIEKQIDAAISATATGATGGLTIDRAAAAESFHMPVGNRWGNYPAIARMQLDTAVAAFAADTTRVIAMQFNKSNGRVVHSWLDLANRSNVWHELSHDSVSNKGAVRADRAQVAKWYAGQLAYLIAKLKEVREGAGTLLDNTLVLHVSEMGAGNHSANDVPFLLAGRGGGAFRTGLFVDARKGGAQRYNNDLLAAVARGFGLPVEWFGVRNRGGNGRFSEGILRAVLAPGVI